MASPHSSAASSADGFDDKMYKHSESLLIYFVFVIKVRENAMRFFMYILI